MTTEKNSLEVVKKLMARLSDCLLIIRNPTKEFMLRLKEIVDCYWFKSRIILDLPVRTGDLFITEMGVKLVKEVEISPSVSA